MAVAARYTPDCSTLPPQNPTHTKHHRPRRLRGHSERLPFVWLKWRHFAQLQRRQRASCDVQMLRTLVRHCDIRHAAHSISCIVRGSHTIQGKKQLVRARSRWDKVHEVVASLSTIIGSECKQRRAVGLIDEWWPGRFVAVVQFISLRRHLSGGPERIHDKKSI